MSETDKHSPIVNTLREFGLSKKEAEVYLALLELGVAGANDIAKQAGINRSSTYVVIESLKKHGLVSMTVDKKVQGYIAAAPETLLKMAEEKSERSARTKKSIEALLPELRTLHKETVFKPKVIVYEGDEANKISHHEIFENSEFRIYKDLSGMRETVPADYYEKDTKKRKEAKMKMFMISPDTPENASIVQEYKKHNSSDEFVLIPQKKFSKSGSSKNIGIGIYRDRIKFASAKDKFAIYIINQAITDTLRDLFDLAWEGTKK